MLNNFITVFKKELLDIIRDRKTLAFTIILPILIYPLMFKVMSVSMKSSEEDAKKEIKLAVEGDTEASVIKILKEQDNIKIEDVQDPKQSLKDGDIQLIINVPENFDKSLQEGKVESVEVLKDDDSNKSGTAASIVQEIYSQYSKQILEGRLASAGIDSDILTPFNVEVKSGISEDGQSNDLGSMIGGMLPSMIVITLLSATTGLASEMGAGEKEKNTLEPLLSTSANRNSLLWGKISTLTLMGIVTLIASTISMIIAFKGYVSDLTDGNTLNISITGKASALILLFGLLLVVALCAIQMCVSMYARSTKEANTYLSGLITPIMLLSFVPMFFDAKNIQFTFFNVPIINSVCVMKEFMVGIYDIKHIIVVLLWQIVYVAISVFLVKIMFSREEVVFRS